MGLHQDLIRYDTNKSVDLICIIYLCITWHKYTYVQNKTQYIYKMLFKTRQNKTKQPVHTYTK